MKLGRVCALRRQTASADSRLPADWRPFAAAVSMLAAAGCAVGPDFVAPDKPPVDRFTPEPLGSPRAGGAAKPQRFDVGGEIPARWWGVFHSKALDHLVEEAIAQNPSLQAAESAIAVARANADAQRGAFFPQVTGSAQPSRNLNYTYSSPVVTPSTPYSLFIGQLSVSYVVDIWGGNRRAVESLDAQAEQNVYQYEAAYLTLATNIVTAAIQEALLRGQIAATQRIVAIEMRVLDVTRKQNALGQIAQADVLAQEAALAQVRQTLPPLEKQLAQQRDLLTALAGRYSTDEIEQKFELSSFTLPRSLPVSLPAQLVEQRPDIKAAEANLHAASAAVGVTIANRLPNIALSANAGSAALSLAQIFGPGSFYYTLAATATQTIFDGGTLFNKQKAAEAALDQAKLQYRNTVIVAFQNVTDALRALQADGRAVSAGIAAERAAFASLDIVQKQVALGQVNQLAILNAQQTYLQALVSRVQAEATRLADTAALFMALGGNWSAPELASIQNGKPFGIQSVLGLPSP